ncbi:MAG TPA: D-TA family PLP-dependent enzyme [Chitinophagaceae bacterium]|nr:D-TA family PLP-dependent enzyme [Chitinophagaceae bacterium]
MSNNNWFETGDIASLDTPALLVYPERVRQNIKTAIAMVGDVLRLRPHVKTNKSPGAVRLMLEAGIRKFKCATIAEAEMLAMTGAKDVVLAYQPLGPKLQRLITLVKKYPNTSFACLSDNMEAAREQSAAFAKNGISLRVFIDLNVGMNRSGIEPGSAAIELYRYLSEAPGVIAAGLHAYDGHIRDLDISLRTDKCNEAFRKVEAMKKELEGMGLAVPVIIAGGSPSFPVHAKRKEVECSPGTFIYWDKGYSDGCPEQDFLPAAVLVTRVVSLPATGIVTTDLGHKSVAAENEITRRIFFLDTNALNPVSQSEEHLVAEAAPDHSFHTGDVLYGLPFHICPTVALYERVYTIEDGKITGEWMNVGRDRKIEV